MNRSSNLLLIEDSLGNRYCFTYKDSSIYCKEASFSGDIKESLLVSQVNEDFIATISNDDNIYLVCHNRTKGILLFTHSDNSWKMADILFTQADITLLDIFAIEGSTHVLYATKLPLANYHNIYHLHNRHGYWDKTSVSENFSENVSLSFSSTITSDKHIHFINVWHDGKKHILKSYFYNNSGNKWLNKKLAALVTGDMAVKLIAEDKNLHMLLQAAEDDISLLFYFVKNTAESDEFNFISLNKMIVGDSQYPPIYNFEEECLYMDWISDNTYYRHVFDMNLREWKLSIEHPVAEDSTFDLALLVKNNVDTVIKRTAYCTVDNKLNVFRPHENTYETDAAESEKANGAPQEADIKKNASIDDLVPYLIDQIKILSDDIKNINTKLNANESTRASSNANKKEPPREDSSKKAQSTRQADLKSSKFKDNFINNKISPSTLSLSKNFTPQSIIAIDTVQGKNTGSFRNAFMGSGMPVQTSNVASATYHGVRKNAQAYSSPETTANKLNYVDASAHKKEEPAEAKEPEPSPAVPKEPDTVENTDTTPLLKRIGDFFKQNFS